MPSHQRVELTHDVFVTFDEKGSLFSGAPSKLKNLAYNTIFELFTNYDTTKDVRESMGGEGLYHMMSTPRRICYHSF